MPKSTLPRVRKRMSDLWAALTTDPELKELAAKSGFELVNVGVDQMDAFMKGARPRVHGVAKQMGCEIKREPAATRPPGTSVTKSHTSRWAGEIPFPCSNPSAAQAPMKDVERKAFAVPAGVGEAAPRSSGHLPRLLPTASPCGWTILGNLRRA